VSLKPIIRIDSHGFMKVMNNTYRNAFYIMFELDIAEDFCDRANSKLSAEIIDNFRY